MMHSIFKSVLITTLFLCLAACNPSGIKEDGKEDKKIDFFVLQSEADEAYLNDDLVTSEKAYEILVKEMPMVAKHWFRLANIYVRTNRPTAAINLYREAVIRDPKYSKAWYNLSIVQLKQTAYSLTEMLTYTSSDDPLYDKAKKMLDDIQKIIE